MGRRELQPQTLEERLIYWTIVSTWGLWLLGALYIVGPVLGYTLMAILLVRALGIAGDPLPLMHIPVGVVLWILGMIAMLLALVVAHLDFELGAAQAIKSIVGWMKGWALMAIYILAGAALGVRTEVIYRATGILAAQTLMLAPVFILASVVGLPAELYVSPLSIVGGSGPEFFDVTLYHLGDTSGVVRWRFFAPWATAAAFLAGIGFVFALYERWPPWKIVGIASSLVVAVMSGSRLSVVALPATLISIMLISNIRRPAVIIGLAGLCAAAVLVTDDLVMAYDDANQAFNSARAASSRVRAALANMAYHRWMTEAPIFGHGIVERGPHLVQFMPIGSHHTWLGLLFVKGAVGFLGLAVPLVWTIGELAIKAQADRVARSALGVILAVALFSFGDNLEIVAYLIWPGLLVVGIALGRKLRNPYVGYLGLQRA